MNVVRLVSNIDLPLQRGRSCSASKLTACGLVHEPTRGIVNRLGAEFVQRPAHDPQAM